MWDRITPSPYVLYGGIKNALDVDNKSYSALYFMNFCSMVIAAALFSIVIFRRLSCWDKFSMKTTMLPYQILEKIKKRDYYDDLNFLDKMRGWAGNREIENDLKRVCVIDDQSDRRLKLEVDVTQMGLLRSYASESNLDTHDQLSIGERSQL